MADHRTLRRYAPPTRFVFPLRAYVNPTYYYHTTLHAESLDEALEQAQAFVKDCRAPIAELAIMPAQTPQNPGMFNAKKAIRVSVH